MCETWGMKAAVIYESMTGNTRALAGKIGDELRSRGIETSVSAITNIDLQAVSDADLVFVGSWTDGLFLVGQKPGRSGRLKVMPTLAGKKTIAFCTFALHPGQVVDKLTRILENRGAEVIGGGHQPPAQVRMRLCPRRHVALWSVLFLASPRPCVITPTLDALSPLMISARGNPTSIAFGASSLRSSR